MTNRRSEEAEKRLEKRSRLYILFNFIMRTFKNKFQMSVLVFIFACFMTLTFANNGINDKRPFIGSTTTYGECEWTGGCGINATGIQSVTTTTYVFWISFQSVTTFQNCTLNVPC